MAISTSGTICTILIQDVYDKLFESQTISVYAIDSEEANYSDSSTQQKLQDALLALRKIDFGSISTLEVAYCIIVASASSALERWTTKKLVSEASDLLNAILESLGGKGSSWSGLFSTHNELVKVLNNLIKSKLKRDQWQDQALTCSVFIWYCTNLKFPLISDNLDVLLPPCLNLMDSYVDEVKLKGVKCLYHVLMESGMAELRWHARSQVIYDALQKLTYTREPSLVSALYPALIKILKVMDLSDPAPQV